MIKMETDLDKKIKNKLKSIVIENIKLIEKDKAPFIRLKARTRSNVTYDKKEGYLKIGNLEEIRKYENVSQVKKYMQTVAVINAVKKIIAENKIVTLRDLFYMLKVKIGEDLDEKIFDEQNQSNSIIVDLELMSGYTREELKIISNPRASAVGNLVAEEIFNGQKLKIDFSKHGSSGAQVAPDPTVYKFISCDAKFILFIEKFAVFNALNQAGFPEKYKALILTSQGYPSRSGRLFVKLVADQYKLPVYILTDADPDGYNIATTLQRGSINLAWLSEVMSFSKAHFIGLKLSDVYKEDYLKYIIDKHLTMPITDHDTKKIKSMKKYEWIKGTGYEKELDLIAEKKIKLESDVLAAKGYNILEKYIIKNIKEKNYI
jgi:DNA topoisomerase-6 subunit A